VHTVGRRRKEEKNKKEEQKDEEDDDDEGCYDDKGEERGVKNANIATKKLFWQSRLNRVGIVRAIELEASKIISLIVYLIVYYARKSVYLNSCFN
jgi:hypothetical protein